MAVEQELPADDRAPRRRSGPLAGVRIADFTWVAAGPLATRFLADLGAEVIKIEDSRSEGGRTDITRRTAITRGSQAQAAGHERRDHNLNSSGMFNNYNRSKLAVTVNMSDPRGRELCERLISKCSVVVENFAPGVMERWGLTYEHVNTLSPEIIYARMSGFGHSGPYEAFRSFGPVVQAVCGLSFISGLPGETPSGWGLSYMDNQGGYHCTNAILAALYHRNETGKGTLIDLSAVEAGVSLIGPMMLDVTVNGAATRGDDFPTGNRLPDQEAAPHGVYPAKGEDVWIAIGVFEDAQWRALKGLMGDPDWAADPRFDTALGRYGAQDELDRRVGEWTKTYDAAELAERLQTAGVTAQAVQGEVDKLERDPQLKARGLYFQLDHPYCGPSLFEGVPIRFSRTQKQHWRSAPLVGEDNAYVYGDILGLSEDELADLRDKGII